MFRQNAVLILVLVSIICLLIQPCSAATTQIHIVKYANDRSTVLSEKTLTYQQMRDTLPVQGDGMTHYFHQGPVFIDDPDPVMEEQLRWNPDEDTNVEEKDMGAVKGTDVRDLCDLVGGMSAGDTLVIKASDGMTKEFAYSNVYSPSSRQGPMVITWYCSGSTFSTCTGPYPDSGYSDGMRLVWFADDGVNPWGIHAFGNFDWHESADPKYWYYYQDGGEKYPTTTGLSVKYVSDILIYSTKSPGSSSSGGGGGVVLPVSGSAPPENSFLYGYSGKKLSTYKTETLNGSVRIFSDPKAVTVIANNRVREFSIPVDVPSGSNITLARLYVYISKSCDTRTNRGVVPLLFVTLNGEEIQKDQMYIDTDGDEHRNVSGTYAYDVLPNIQENGTYNISLRNLDFDEYVFTVEGVMLLLAYEHKQGLSSQYWISEGCDVVLSQPKRGIFSKDASTSFAFAGIVNNTQNSTADLILVSTGIDTLNTTEHGVRFNKGTWYNAFDNHSGAPIIQIPVDSYLNESGNSASVESTIRKMDADYLVNRNAILVISQNKSTTDDFGSNQVNTTSVQHEIPIHLSIFNTSASSNTTASCRLSLHSDPEGALIFINGSYLGKTTPSTIEVNPGDQYRVRLELDGFVPAERNLSINNHTMVWERLYSEVYSTKGRSDTLVQERDITHNGGLYIKSRPGPAIISLDGIRMPQRTPAVIYGLKEGTYTVQLSLEQGNPSLKERSEIAFEDQEVYVHPYCIVPVDVTAQNSPSGEIIIDSHGLRGEPFTVYGQTIRKTIPDKITTPLTDAFITIFHNQSYISFTLPMTMNEDHYLMIEPRQHYNLNVFVDSSPRGAEVFIDGFRTGYSTPFTISNISDGPHRIMVSKTGYIPQERIITLLYTPIPLSTTTVSFKLEEYTNGFLRVASDPSGAKITLDGMDTGEITPFIFFALPIGSHSINVDNNTIARKYPDITVNALDFINISADFHEIPD